MYFQGAIVCYSSFIRGTIAKINNLVKSSNIEHTNIQNTDTFSPSVETS